MSKSLLSAACAAVLLTTTSAFASPLPAVNGSYDGIYVAGNAYSGHGLWLPHLLKDGSGSYVDTQWSVDSSQSSAVATNGSLTLKGVVSNQSNPMLQLSYSLFLNEISHTGGSQCGGHGVAAGQTSCTSTAAADVAARDQIKFYEFDASQTSEVTGLGGLSGLALSLSIKPGDGSKPPQFGYGGNWLDMNFGYSNWFYYKSNVASVGNYKVRGFGGGDINLTLAADPNNNLPPAVPLPAGLPMLLGALGLLGFLRRKSA